MMVSFVDPRWSGLILDNPLTRTTFTVFDLFNFSHVVNNESRFRINFVFCAWNSAKQLDGSLQNSDTVLKKIPARHRSSHALFHSFFSSSPSPCHILVLSYSMFWFRWAQIFLRSLFFFYHFALLLFIQNLRPLTSKGRCDTSQVKFCVWAFTVTSEAFLLAFVPGWSVWQEGQSDRQHTRLGSILLVSSSIVLRNFLKLPTYT